MLKIKQDPRTIQRISMLIKRRRPTFGGSGIFYHTDLRRQILVPIDPTIDMTEVTAYNLSQAGLSSQIGTQFEEHAIPVGYRVAHLYSILGSVEDAGLIRVYNLDNDEVEMVNPNTLPCIFEIMDTDLLILQNQNQNALMLECEGFIQQNHQDYGEGFDYDGRDRNLLKGSLWVTPVNNTIEVFRPQLRSAANSAEEIRNNTEQAKLRAADRAVKATAESWANRDTAERYRAQQPIPKRRGTNTVLQIGSPHFERSTKDAPYGEGSVINL